MNLSKAKLLIETYYDVQGVRIQCWNATLASAKHGILKFREASGSERIVKGMIHVRWPGDPDEDVEGAPRRRGREFTDKDKWKKLVPSMETSVPGMIWKICENPHDKGIKVPIESVISWTPWITVADAQAQRDWTDERMQKMEDELKGQIDAEINQHPFWNHWLSKIRGVGPCLGGALLARIDITRARTPSSLYKLFGLHVVDGHAVKMERGKFLGYDPFLKRTAFLIGDSFIKIKNGGFYRSQYELFRAEIDAKPCPLEAEGKKHMVGRGESAKAIPCPKSHKLAMARRKTVKLFLSHLWTMWREFAHLPTVLPYAFDKLGHPLKDLIPPPREGDRW